jgi:hypothetical protein
MPDKGSPQVTILAETAAEAMRLLNLAAWHPDYWADLDVITDALAGLQAVAGGIPPSLDRIIDQIHETRPGEDVANAIARAHLGSILLLADQHAESLVNLLHTATRTARSLAR